MPGKKFRFSLKNVLELRRHETERAQNALAEAEAVLNERRERLEQARNRHDAHRRSVTRGDTLRPATLRKEDAFRQKAQQAVAEALDAVRAAEAKVDDARAALQKRRRAEEALETLREKEKQEHEQAQAKAETAVLDEQAILRYSRANPMSLMA